jgi:hypothetical protein
LGRGTVEVRRARRRWRQCTTAGSTLAVIPWWPRARFVHPPPPPPPPPPILAAGGPDLGRRRCPRRLSAVDLCPGRSLSCADSLGAPSAGGMLACCCGCPFSGISGGVSPSVGKMRQGPLVVARRAPRVGAARAVDRRLAPPEGQTVSLGFFCLHGGGRCNTPCYGNPNQSH